MNEFVDRHAENICGVLACPDRIVISGSLPEIGYDKAITRHLYAKGVRCFDYAQWASPYRDLIQENAKNIAADNDLEVHFIRKHRSFRKDEFIEEVLRERGNHPGLVYIFSAMETCNTFEPWHDKKTKRTYMRPSSGRCLHYYFYFIDEYLGLCYLRVPTWAPFRLQFYFNGHNYLARALSRKQFAYRQIKNAFTELEDYEEAQALVDKFSVKKLHKILDYYARRFCPAARDFRSGYHWSLMQVEFAVDVMFKSQKALKPLYENLTRTAIHAVKPDHVYMFLGRKPHANFQGELGGRFETRVQGTCVKHFMDKAGIKVYDKFGSICRVECTTHDVTFFKHFREVVHRDGSKSYQTTGMRKTIYSLPDLFVIMRAACNRYYDFLASIDDPNPGMKRLKKIAKPVRKNERSYRGFNLFAEEDLDVFLAVAEAGYMIQGFKAKHLREKLRHKSSSQISRIIKRLRLHGLVKKVGKSYRYYLSKLGRSLVATALKLRSLVVIPELNKPFPSKA